MKPSRVHKQSVCMRSNLRLAIYQHLFRVQGNRKYDPRGVADGQTWGTRAGINQCPRLPPVDIPFSFFSTSLSASGTSRQWILHPNIADPICNLHDRHLVSSTDYWPHKAFEELRTIFLYKGPHFWKAASKSHNSLWHTPSRIAPSATLDQVNLVTPI